MRDTKETRVKFTTTLSLNCLESLKQLRSKYGIKYDNHLIEYIIAKEMGDINNEMDKQPKK